MPRPRPFDYELRGIEPDRRLYPSEAGQRRATDFWATWDEWVEAVVNDPRWDVFAPIENLFDTRTWQGRMLGFVNDGVRRYHHVQTD